jgi:hypothetical protein
MLRRLSSPLPLILVATLGLFALTNILLAQSPVPGGKNSDIKRTQEENKKFYERFATDMLKLAQRWEKSDSTEDKERAKALRAALKLAEEKGVDTLFKELVTGLGSNGSQSTGEVQKLLGKDEKLIAALEELLLTLQSEDEAARTAREIRELKEMIKEIERLKREQENLRARTENPRSDAERIAREQNNLAKQTQDIANKLAGKDNKDNKNAGGNQAGKDEKAEAKPENKPGESSPEAKPDTQENKSESKSGDAAGNPMDPKGGDSKSGSEAKPSPMGGMDPGSSKDSKDGPMAGGEPKPGEPKPMGGGNPKDPKEPKNGGDQKPMAGESKAQGDGKGESKPSAGQPGGEAKPMSGQESPMGGGQPSASKPSGGQPSGGQPSGGQPSGGQPKPNDQAQENIQQAVPQQKGAEEDLRKNDRDNASKKEDEAIKKLEDAIRELEKRLKQLREKELAKLLGNLEERVGRMLRMQQEVLQATQGIHNTIKRNKDQRTSADVQKAGVEAEKESLIVIEANKALKLMEAESSAVVFAGVLNQVKGDMEAVQKRLNETRVEGRNAQNQAEGTQLIEEDIIEQLTMMKDALKKAKQELENQQNNPPPSDGNGKPPSPKLIDLINELKLVKSLQEQVNKRTVSYSKQEPGVQSKDPLIQNELKQLSDRQKVLQEMLHKIATQANQ